MADALYFLRLCGVWCRCYRFEEVSVLIDAFAETRLRANEVGESLPKSCQSFY